MKTELNDTARNARRTLICASSLAMAFGGMLSSREARAAKSCEDFLNHGNKTDYEELDTPPANWPNEEPGLLARAILKDFNDNYNADKTEPIVMWRKKLVKSMIQRHKVPKGGVPLPWTFKKAPLKITNAIRIPYFGAAKNGKRCVAEHILIGYVIESTAAVGSVAWADPTKSQEYSVIGGFIVDFLREDGGSAAAMPNWINLGSNAKDNNESFWEFRGMRLHVDNAVKIPYAVASGGKMMNASLYVGYEGGGAY